MKSIQPFIDLGFYTVPLKGELKRLEDGKKTTPQFEKNWKAKYQEEFNEFASSIGGVLTGAISNIIAIDCDSQVTYEIFRSLDNSNKFHFVSKGKPKGGGTIIYKYPSITDGIAPISSFSIQDELINLDFYAENGFVYLPTSANETKEAWPELTLDNTPEISELPNAVYTLLKSLYKQYLLNQNANNQEETPTEKQVHKANYLAPQIELMLNKNEFIPSVFRVITPKDFRALEQYVKMGYLQPKNIPEGRGSEYLSKVSAILGSDPSISKDLYIKTIHFINELWTDPIKRDRLNSTIVNPMIEGKASINGVKIWQYDEHWKDRGLTFTTKFGDAAEIFFDDIRAIYYLINNTTSLISAYHKDTDIYSYMEAVGIAIPTRKEFKPMLPLVRTTMNPALPFGFYSQDEYTRSFNMFQQTPALRILNNPIPYKTLYNRPQTTISFFESLVPEDIMRNYLLKFLKYKLTTFNYSPVVLYFLGRPGSGKDTLVNILASIIGTNYIGRPTTKEFLEQFNGYMVDKYFIHLDEYGNQLVRMPDKQEALGKIKAYSGKETIQIRQMRTDGFPYKHSGTFIMTANTHPLILEDEDRRMAFFDTPNVLKDEKWVIQAGGITTVQEQLAKEINDFCYYLATEVDDFHRDEYMSPPITQNKHKIISSKLPVASRIAYYFKNNMLDQVYDLCAEYDLSQVLAHTTEGRVYEEDLFTLYSAMTDNNGVKRGMNVALKDAGFEKIPTSKQGVKIYYYNIPILRHYTPPNGGFQQFDTSEILE